MGLFSKKKEEKKEAFRLHQFHEEFPRYESTVSSSDMETIKEAISKPEEKPPMYSPPKMTFAAPPIKGRSNISLLSEKPMSAPYAEEPKTSYSEEDNITPLSETQDIHRQERALFIKIDRYKESIDKIDHIKQQIDEIMKVISRINELKAEEDAEISYCNQELNNIKEGISSIERILFGK